MAKNGKSSARAYADSLLGGVTPAQQMINEALTRIGYRHIRPPANNAAVVRYALCRLPLSRWRVAEGVHKKGWWDIPFYVRAWQSRRRLRGWFMPLVRDGVVDVKSELDI